MIRTAGCETRKLRRPLWGLGNFLSANGPRSVRRLGHGARALLAGSCGATAIQYAVMLAGVVMGALMLAGLGHDVADKFAEASGGLTGPAVAMSQPSVVVPEAHAVREEPEVPRWRRSSTYFAASLCVLVVTFVAAATVALRRKSDDPLDDSAQLPGTEEMSDSERRCLFAKRQRILRILRQNKSALFKSEIHVRHLMSDQLISIRPDTPASDLAQMMRDRKIRHILVCENEDRLVGVVSDRDVRGRQGKTAADMMTRDPLTAKPDESVGHVVTLMMHEHISCVPVVEEGRLCGILTTTDLMMSLHCTLQILVQLAASADISAELATPPTKPGLRETMLGEEAGNVGGVA